MDELIMKFNKFKIDVQIVGNFYDYIYYLVVVNLECVKKVFDKFLSDLLDKLEK